MSDPTHNAAALRAAMDLWEPLAAAAWERYVAVGRGVLMLDEEDLLTAHDDAASGRPASLAPGFVPTSIVPRGDDFRSVLLEYDPETQVPLLLRDAEGGETLLVLDRTGTERPSPETCYRNAAPDGDVAGDTPPSPTEEPSP